MRNPKIHLLVQLVTIIIVMLNFISHELLVSCSLIIAVALIVLIGIPHGANDHLLFFNLFKKRALEEGSKTALFFLYYLGLIFLYVCSWFFLPAFSLGIFILISIYHFGQSNLYSIPLRSAKGKFLSIFLSGTFVLLTPILAHIETALPIIEILSKKTDLPSISNDFGKKLAILLGILMLLHWCLIILLKIISIEKGLFEIVNVLLLFGLFYYSPLWIGFAIYFTLWHAVPSIEDQINFFKRTRSAYNLGKYLREIFPFSVIALSGLFFAYQFSENIISVNQAIALLFSFIAVITLPHMIMMDLLYQGIEEEKTEENLNM